VIEQHLAGWQTVVEGGWRNKLAYLGLADLQMPIIHTWNVSLNMWNFHTNYRRAVQCCPKHHTLMILTSHHPCQDTLLH
jgi:hypothetical protein